MNPKPNQLVALLGQGVSPAGGCVITADDLGLTRGDGAFDATRVRTQPDGTSEVDHLEAHLARFATSIAALDGPVPDLDAWRALIDDVVSAWSTPGEAVLKLMWTRGQESALSVPTQVATLTALTEATMQARRGLHAITLCRGTASDAFVDRGWLLGGVKSLSYGVNAAAQREARRRGAGEVVFTSTDGFCLEGPTSSLVVLSSGRLVTTPRTGTGILASITQQVIFDAARSEGVPVSDALLTPADVTTADAAWLVSSVRGIAPLLTLDETPVPQSDEWTARLRAWTGFDQR